MDGRLSFIVGLAPDVIMDRQGLVRFIGVFLDGSVLNGVLYKTVSVNLILKGLKASSLKNISLGIALKGQQTIATAVQQFRMLAALKHLTHEC